MDRQNKLKIIITYLLLLLIAIGGLSARLFRLGESPTSLNWDEASLGYNAYSLLKTGKDEYSKILPLSLRSFDDYKPAIYSYLVIPLLLKLPLSDSTVRLPSAILGSILTLPTFVITFLLTKSRKAGLFSSLSVAFAPWALHFSRIAFEANIATSILYLGLCLLVYSMATGRKLYLSVIMFILSMYTYHSQRALALPLLGTLLFVHRKKINIKIMALIAILLVPLGLSFLKDPITSRLTITNVLRLWPFVPNDYPMLIYNPLFSLLWHIVGHFISYMSPFNLFVRGSTEPGQYIPTLGLLQMIEFPFWIIGSIAFFTKRKLRRFLAPILILSTFPALITWNWFSVVRTLPLYPIFSILIGIGVFNFFQLIPTKIIRIILGIIVAAIWIPSTIYLINTEIIYAPVITYGEYQPGFEKGIPALLLQAQNYEHIVIDSPHIAPYIFLLFYGKYDPALYQQQNPNIDKNIGTENLSFGKFEFRQIDWTYDRNLPHTLFMGPTGRLPDYEFNHPGKLKVIKDIYDVKGYISFRIVATN